MSQAQLAPVPFHGDTIFCINHQGQPYTPMRPIVENMGLDWSTQFRKLKSNQERWGVVMMTTPPSERREKQGITIIVTPSDSGEQQTLCLPVRKLPAYLASINPKKVRAELRAKIELYQAESDDALWNYWMNGRAERAEAAPQTGLSPAQRAELKAIVDAKLSTSPASVQGKARAEIWTRFNRHFRIAEYAQLLPELMPEARDLLIEMRVRALTALPPTEAEPELAPVPVPTGERPLIYRDGKFYPPRRNRRHVAGPREKAAFDFWRGEFGRLEQELDEKFRALLDGINRAAGNDLYPHAVAVLGREADTMFSISCLLEGLYLAQDKARACFKEALQLAGLHMRLSTEMAVALNR